MTSTPRSIVWRDVALVAAAAAAVRLVAFFLNARGNPAFDYLIMDSAHIDQWARALAAGEGSGGVYFRGPLVPYLLSLVYRASGGSVAAAVLLNHAAGAATCALVYLLAREYFGRAVAITAGLLAALYWPMIYFEGEILIEPVFILLAVLGLWRLARAAARPTAAGSVTAGALIGLAALARPTILALLPAIPIVYLASRADGDAPASRARRLRLGLAAAAAALVMLLPAAIHNYRAERAFVPVTWSGGLNFYIGNNASSDGRSAFLPAAGAEWMGGGDEALALAASEAGRPLKAAEASNLYLRKGLSWIASDPGGAAVLALKKLYMFWEGPERSNEKYLYFFWHRFGLGRAQLPGFWLVSPLALAAMALLWPRRRELSLLYLFVLAYLVGVVAFFVVARYRLPAAPVLVIFAAWTLVECFESARGRRRGALARAGALVVAFFAIANASYPSFFKSRAQHLAMAHYTLAGAHMRSGNEEGVLRELGASRRAFEQAPSRYYAAMAQDIYFKLGVLWYERGRCDEAISALANVLPSDPRAKEALVMFADCCEKMDRMVDAGRAYESILGIEPGNRDAMEGIIRCLEATGAYGKAAGVRKMLDASGGLE